VIDVVHTIAVLLRFGATDTVTVAPPLLENVTVERSMEMVPWFGGRSLARTCTVVLTLPVPPGETVFWMSATA